MDEHATVTAPQSHPARRTPARRMRAAAHEGWGVVEALVGVQGVVEGDRGACFGAAASAVLTRLAAAVVAGAEALAHGGRFDPAVDRLVDVAETLDGVYEAATTGAP